MQITNVLSKTYMIINEPTRIGNPTATPLDHIYTNDLRHDV